jgi:hypothetical protein
MTLIQQLRAIVFGRKRPPASRPETASQRAERMRRSLRHNPTTGAVLITRRYRDACIDEILEGSSRRSR